VPSLVKIERSFLLEMNEFLVKFLSKNAATNYKELFRDNEVVISESYSPDEEDENPNPRISFWMTEYPRETVGRGQPSFFYSGEIVCVGRSSREALLLHRRLLEQVNESWRRNKKVIESSVSAGIKISVGLPQIGEATPQTMLSKNVQEYAVRAELSMSASQTL
jgi:hypothetical protein